MLPEHATHVRYCDLPPGVGHKTVERLANKGLAKVVDPRAGRHSKAFTWRLVRWSDPIYGF